MCCATSRRHVLNFERQRSGQRSEIGDQRLEVGDQRSEVRGGRWEVGGGRSEIGDDFVIKTKVGQG